MKSKGKIEKKYIFAYLILVIGLLYLMVLNYDMQNEVGLCTAKLDWTQHKLNTTTKLLSTSYDNYNELSNDCYSTLSDEDFVVIDNECYNTWNIESEAAGITGC